MNAWTRRLTMPLAFVLLAAGCASGLAAIAAAGSPRADRAPSAAAQPSRRIRRRAGHAAATSPTVAEIARLEALVAADPADADAQRDLGFALLQRVRETADPSLYAPAAEAFETARKLAPDDALVLVGIGGLQLGKHQFAEALRDRPRGRRAVAEPRRGQGGRRRCPRRARALRRGRRGRRGDARDPGRPLDAGPRLVRRGAARQARRRAERDAAGRGDARSGAGERGLRRCAARQPARLHGRPGGRRGRVRRTPSRSCPAHAPSLAGQGRLAVGAGDLDGAIALFQRAADILPLPEYVIALAEAQAAAGRAADAARNIKLARAEIQLFEASGRHRRPRPRAVRGGPRRSRRRRSSSPRRPTRRRPTVRAADALAWALHRLGRDDEAKRRSDEALRLGLARPAAALPRGRDRRRARRRRRRAPGPRPGPRDRPGLLGDRRRGGPSDPRFAARLSPPERRFIQPRRSCASATTAQDGGRDPFSCTRPRRASGRSEDPPPRHQGRLSCPHDRRSPASPAPCSSRRHPSRGVFASSHREAPLIAGDPAADNTDLYAFVSPDDSEQPDHHRQLRPARGAGRRTELLPVRPERPLRDQHRQQRQRQGATSATSSGSRPTARPTNFAGIPTFLYNDGPITTPERPEPARLADLRRLAQRQQDRVERARPAGQHRAALHARLRGPCRVRGQDARPTGPSSSPGQRDDAFFVDLGSIFDLAGLRPFNTLHALPLPTEAGVDGVSGFNTNSIAIQVPLQQLTKDHAAADRPERPRRRPRRVGIGQPPEVPHAQCERHDVGQRPVAAGLSPRQPADQRGDHPDRQEGLLEQPEAQQATRSSRSTTRRRRSPRSPTRCTTRSTPRRRPTGTTSWRSC